MNAPDTQTPSPSAPDERAPRLVTRSVAFAAEGPNGFLLEGVTTGFNERGFAGHARILEGREDLLGPGLRISTACAFPGADLPRLDAVILRLEPSRDPSWPHFLAARFDAVTDEWAAYIRNYIAWKEDQDLPGESPVLGAAAAPPLDGALPAENDLGAWYRGRLVDRRERLRDAASSEGLADGTADTTMAGPLVVREACQLAVTARLAGLPGVAQAAEKLASALPGSGMKDALARLESILATAESAPAPATSTLLLVEHDGAARRFLAEALADLPVRILEAGSAAEARALLAHTPSPLILLDLARPASGGRELLRELAADPAHESTSIVTLADAGTTGGEETLAEGASIFLYRPIEPGVLRRILAHQHAIALARLAARRIDPATGLASRAGFCEELERTVALTQRVNRPLSLALLELEGVEHVAAEHGQAAADALVGVAANILGGSLRTSDVLGRWSGHRFAAAFPNTSAAQARRAVEKVLAAAALATIEGRNGTAIPPRFHAGIAGVGPGTILEELVARAYRRLAQARQAGSGEIRVEPDDRGDYRMAVLVADSDPLTRDVIAHRFAREGYEVETCEDGLAAVESVLFGGTLHTFFVIDLHLPRINGLDLVRRLRAMSKHTRTPILLLAVAGQASRLSEGLQMGANDYMTKPFSPLELITRARRLVRPG